MPAVEGAVNAISPAWESFWQEARDVDILEVAERMGCKLRKQGDDWVGACPRGCASSDGFVVTPTKWMFWCRPSGDKGGAIEMYCHAFPEMTKTEAAEFVLGRDRPDGKREETPEEKEARERRRAEAEQRGAEIAAARERDRLEKLRRDEEAVADILARVRDFPGSYAERYMREDRGITLPKRMTRDLRFVPDLAYFGYADAATKELAHIATAPAMVALIRALSGDVVGLHITYLDPERPTKWVAPWEADRPKGKRRNLAKKFRKTAERLNGAMIRLGVISETLVVGEGIETTGAYFQLGLAPEDASFAVAMSLGNMVGGALQQIPHPTKRDASGQMAKMPSGVPDMAKPGLALPDHVRALILLGDSDSDPVSTRKALQTGVRRYRAEGRAVEVHMARPGEDWNDALKGWRGA